MVVPILTPAEMDEIGADLAIARPSTCRVLRKPTGRDPGGAPVSGAYAEVASVGCRVEATNRQARETVVGGRFGPEADYTVAVPRGTDVREEDRIAVNGQTLEVVGVPGAESFSFEVIVAAKDAT